MVETREEQMRRFLSERALKALFLTDWYVNAVAAMQLDAPTRETLEQIAAETAQEQKRAEDTFREWQERMAADDIDRLETFDAEILHAAHMGFFKVLIEAKDASAVFFQKAALTAPKDLADRFAQLGSRDFDHAMRLRRALADIFYTASPHPAIEQGRTGPRP